MDLKKFLNIDMRPFAAALVLLSIAAGSVPAQKRQPGRSVPAKKAGWSGVVTYSKTLNDDFSSDEKLFGRVHDEERIKHNITRNYSYTGRLVVNDLAGTGRPSTTANVSFKESDNHKTTQTELTNCHSWEPSRLIKAESTERKTTSGTGSGEARSFSMSVNGDRGSLSFTLPQISGRYANETSSAYSNLCSDSTRKPSRSSDERDVVIPGGGASIDIAVDPKNPDVVEGSKTWTDGATSTSKGFTHTITWRLRRTPQPLIITDIRLMQPIFPSPNDWRDFEKNDRVVDGNQVKVVATIANLGGVDKNVAVDFRETKENALLAEQGVSATIPANGQKDVELIWDTSGYSWKSSGADVVPEINRVVEVKIPDDSMQKELTVVPKPVIVVWGLWQWGTAMTKFRDYFRAVSDKWQVWPALNDARKISTDNADGLDAKVREVQRYHNAWHVDLVALQNGGLVGRVYINSKMPMQFDGRPTATNLVMVGVPNLGTPCATGLYGLSFKLNTLNLDAVGELSPDSMKRFNLLVNNTNGTKFSAIAVDNHTATCQEDGIHGDGLVPVRSALWRTKRNFISRVSMTPRDILGEVTHFKQIYKWLAVPPKGDHGPEQQTLAANNFDDDPLSPRRISFVRTAFDDPHPQFATSVKIDAGKTSEIEIPVGAGSRFSLNLLADPEISVSLLNERGDLIATNTAGSPESMEVIRSLQVNRSFSAGKWKVRLESRLATPTEAVIVAFIDAASDPTLYAYAKRR